MMSDLCGRWMKFKIEEQEARRNRLEVEADMERELGVKKGVEDTYRYSDGLVKAKATSKFTYKVDEKEFRKIEMSMNSHDIPLRKKLELDVAKWKQLQKSRPKVAEKFATCLTVKQAKTAFNVEFENE